MDPEKVGAASIWPLPVKNVFCALPASTAISHQHSSPDLSSPCPITADLTVQCQMLFPESLRQEAADGMTLPS